MIYSCGESKSHYYKLGVSYFNNGEFKYAIDAYTDAIELDNKYTNAYINRGVIFIEIGNYKDAMKDLSKAISLDPNDAQIYYNRGILYDKLKDFSNAIDDYTRAINRRPNYSQAYYNRGVSKFNSMLPAFAGQSQVYSKLEACIDLAMGCDGGEVGSCEKWNRYCN